MVASDVNKGSASEVEEIVTTAGPILLLTHFTISSLKTSWETQLSQAHEYCNKHSTANCQQLKLQLDLCQHSSLLLQ